MDDDSVEKWQHTDEEIQKNLPPGMKLIHTLQGHKRNISLIKWSPDGRILTSSSGNGIIRQWDTETGECLNARMLPGSGLHSFAFNQAGDMLASTNDNTVKLWEVTSGKLIHNLEGHADIALKVAFNQAGDILASTSGDYTIKLWEVTRGKLIHTLEGHAGIVFNVAFNPTGDKLASISGDMTVKLWEVTSGKLIYTLEEQAGNNSIVVFNPIGDTLASASDYKTIKLWEVTSGKLINTLEGKIGHSNNIIFDPLGHFLAIPDGMVINVYDASTGKLLKILEGHTGEITSGIFSPWNSLFASRSMHRREIFLWRTDTFECVAKINFGVANRDWVNLSIAFHPYLPYLAGVIWDTTDADGEPSIIHVYELDLDVLLGQVSEPNAHYLNAKVVMVGDTGVGKTGLSLVLNNQPFEATDSTPGRRVWTFESQEVNVGSNTMQTREMLLWDLAGQPGYRIIHQLHLNEVAVALVIFDARSETLGPVSDTGSEPYA